MSACPGISVGVDVFFVISGFLIISQIVEGLERGSFSFAEFWARRALRILPPYLLVLGSTMTAAAFVLVMPDELNQFAKEVGYASIMGANHFFLNQQGYFDTAADSKVLLHAWSLAVEEQFYLVAPLMLALTWRLPKWLGRAKLRRPLILWVSIAVFAASLAGCIYLTTGGRNYAFYVAALRAWEFVAGGAISFLLPFVSPFTARFRTLLAEAGLAAIVAAALLYGADTSYPSWRAMVPVLGATAVILGGIAEPKSAAARLLATAPMVWIGLFSYSWYLWHWPLLALARIANFGERDFALDAGLALVSLALAAATHFGLERPIRLWRQRRGKPLGWRPVLTGIVLCAALGLGGWKSFSETSVRITAALPPLQKPARVKRVPICDLGASTADECNSLAAGRPLGMLTGDSHATCASRAFSLFAWEHGAALALMSAPGCAPMFETRLFIPDSKMAAACAHLKNELLPVLAEHKVRPEFAVLYASWPIYTKEKGHKLGALDAAEPAADQSLRCGPARHDRRSAVLGHETHPGHRAYAPFRPAAGAVLVPGGSKEPRSRQGLWQGTQRSGGRKQSGDGTNCRWLAGFDRSVRFIDPLDDFYDSERCLPYSADTLLFVDTNHANDLGAQRLTERHAADFEWLVGGAGRL